MEENLKPIYKFALDRIAKRDYSVEEMRRKLVSRFELSGVSQILEKLQEKKFLDDERFAEGLVRRYQRIGKGAIYIRQKLYQKGVPESVIKSALESEEVDPRKLAREVLERKFDNVEITKENFLKIKSKAVRFLAGRGFPSDVVYSVVGEYFDRDW